MALIDCHSIFVLLLKSMGSANCWLPTFFFKYLLLKKVQCLLSIV